MATRVIPVCENIWCIYSPSYFNCSYLISREGKNILIDAGMRSDGRVILKAMEKLGFRAEDTQAILLTHWHNDHSAGTAEIKARSGCDTYGHPLEKPYFEQTPSGKLRRLADWIPEYGIFVLFKGLIGDTVPRNVAIDHCVTDGNIILNDFEVIESPGHTPGHISFYDRKSKTLFAGDSLAVIRGRLRLMARPVTPDKPTSLKSILHSLSNRDIQNICPGHREPLRNITGAEIKRFTRFVRENGHNWPLLG